MKMAKKNWRVVAVCFPFLFSACANNGAIEEAVTEESHILFSVDDFEAAGSSRSVTYWDEVAQKYRIKWTKGDIVGVFPYEGYQEPFEIPEDQFNQNTATFDGGYWALKDGFTYNAYYPFSVDNFASADAKKSLSISYVGQAQRGNDYGVGAYDYMYSDWETAANGSVKFQFHHIGCLTIFGVTYPVTATFTRLAVNTGNDDLIPTAGTYDLTYNHGKTPEEGKTYVKIPFVADDDAKAYELGMALYNAEGTAGISGTKGQTATFYMMLPPMDLSQASAKVFLTDSNNNVYESDLTATNFEAGKKYAFDLTLVHKEINGSAPDSDDSEFGY